MSDPLQSISNLRSAIYDVLIKRYGHLPAHKVLQALKDASEDMYESGVDECLQFADIGHLDHIADAWDLTWLTALAIRLSQIK